MAKKKSAPKKKKLAKTKLKMRSKTSSSTSGKTVVNKSKIEKVRKKQIANTGKKPFQSEDVHSNIKSKNIEAEGVKNCTIYCERSKVYLPKKYSDDEAERVAKDHCKFSHEITCKQKSIFSLEAPTAHLQQLNRIFASVYGDHLKHSFPTNFSDQHNKIPLDEERPLKIYEHPWSKLIAIPGAVEKLAARIVNYLNNESLDLKLNRTRDGEMSAMVISAVAEAKQPVTREMVNNMLSEMKSLVKNSNTRKE